MRLPGLMEIDGVMPGECAAPALLLRSKMAVLPAVPVHSLVLHL